MTTVPELTATDMGGPDLPRMPKKIFLDSIGRNPYIPKLPHLKQAAFLELECLDALIGGSASGGKSEALLMGALQFVTVPGYAALIVRRKFKDLELPGGLIDRSIEWLKGKAHYNAQEHRWRFKEGGTLQFGYADNEGDERRYDGSEFAYIAADEAAGFTEKQLVFFFERLRKRKEIPVPVRYRLGTTPGGPGHEFIKKKYVDPGTKGVGFIPANVWDNPAIDATQYIESLEQTKTTDPVRYRRMLLGDWDAVDGGKFKREWFGHWRREPGGWAVLTPYTGGEPLERFRPDSCGCFQTCDPAASTSKDADFFVLSTWLVTPKAHVVWYNCHRAKYEIQDQVTVCQRLYRSFKPQLVAVEEVMNQRALAQLLRRSTSPTMVVKGVSPKGQNKADHAAGFITLAASGRVFLPEPPCGDFPLDEVISELVTFTGDPSTKTQKDDICFVAGTMVETEHGPRPIEIIHPGEKVWTRQGLQTVLAAGMTSESSPTLQARFSNGATITGTAKHPVFIEGKGFVSLDSLSYGDKIVTWENHEQKRPNSTGEPTFATPIPIGASTASTSSATTISALRTTSTGTYGCFTTGRSRRGITFITKTVIRSTTTSRISCALIARNTDDSKPSKGRVVLQRYSPILTEYGRSRSLGTVPPKAWNSTKKLVANPPPHESFAISYAKCATRRSRPNSERPNFAAPTVRKSFDTIQAPTAQSVRVRCADRLLKPTDTAKQKPAHVSVLTISEGKTQAVFNLTVAEVPEFFANGVLVHNCDTGSMMADVLHLVRNHATGTARPPVWYQSKSTPLGGLK